MTALPVVLLLLAAPAPAPVPLPAPRPAAIAGCVAAACTGDPRVRVCKCIPASADQRPGLLVDREGDRHVEWDATAWRGEVGDFQALLADLDGDGEPELVVANPARESSLRHEVTFEVAVVDGVQDQAAWGLMQDFAPDAVGPGGLLFTEYEHGGERPVLVGREYGYRAGALFPTRAPVLRRAVEEGGRDGGSGSPRRQLQAPAARPGLDEPAAGGVGAVVRGVSTDEGELQLHLETARGTWLTLGSGREARPPLRLGDLAARRLYPAGYLPADAPAWLMGRAVRGDLDALQSGVLWVLPPSKAAGGP